MYNKTIIIVGVMLLIATMSFVVVDYIKPEQTISITECSSPVYSISPSENNVVIQEVEKERCEVIK
jgi:hypothetical protein